MIITYDLAVKAFGCEPDLNDDCERAAFFAVWAMVEAELGMAMMRAKADVAADERRRESRP